MSLSLTPLLVAIELGFLLALLRRAGRTGRVDVLYAHWGLVALTAVVAIALGARDLYVAEAFLSTLPGLWLSAATLAVCALPALLSARIRDALRHVVDSVPPRWLAYFHALRIGALGTAYKTWIGEFPVAFEWIVGVPDLLFGLSALWAGARLRRGALSRRGFLAWNLLGVLVIVPTAPLVLQLSLPGPLQLFDALPDGRAVLAFPMSIAPSIGVPLFVLMNLWVAWRLWERRPR